MSHNRNVAHARRMGAARPAVPGASPQRCRAEVPARRRCRWIRRSLHRRRRALAAKTPACAPIRSLWSARRPGWTGTTAHSSATFRGSGCIVSAQEHRRSLREPLWRQKPSPTVSKAQRRAACEAAAGCEPAPLSFPIAPGCPVPCLSCSSARTKVSASSRNGQPPGQPSLLALVHARCHWRGGAIGGRTPTASE